MPEITPPSAFSKSASSNTMCGDLPPSSSPAGISRAPATAAIARPVSVPPVNDTIRTPGCATSAAPTSSPWPGSTVSRPSGRPASAQIRASSSASIGVSSEGLRITALPAASAGAAFCASAMIGEFHGVIAATTPKGSASDIEKYSPRGEVSSFCQVSQTAA